jgi:acyl-CoA synthetase (AMP-forming)/AMP-acid ligase II
MEPFQIVRMVAVKILVGRPEFHGTPPFPSRVELVAVTQVEDRWPDRIRRAGRGPHDRAPVARFAGKEAPFRPTWSRTRRAGARSRGARPSVGSTRSRTGFSPWASARATPSRSSDRTRIEWALIDFALGLVGAIGAPVYPTSSAADCTYIVAHSEAVGMLVEDDEQRAKVEDGREPCRVSARSSRLRSSTISPHAVGVLGGAPRRARARDGRDREDDLFTYIYTSGRPARRRAA